MNREMVGKFFHGIPGFDAGQWAHVRSRLMACGLDPSTVKLYESLVRESVAKRGRELDAMWVPIYGQAEAYPGKRQFRELAKRKLVFYKPGTVAGGKAIRIGWQAFAEAVGEPVGASMPILAGGYGVKVG